MKKLAGRLQEIHAERDWKLEAAMERRKNRRRSGRVTDETDYFRFADNPLTEAQPPLV